MSFIVLYVSQAAVMWSWDISSLKTVYRDNVKRLERGGVDTIGKQHFTSLCGPAREVAFSKSNIIAAWNKAGLVPFKPDRVLSAISKPACETSTASRPRRTVSKQDTTPRTPITPVSIETLVSLQDIIVQQNACTLDDTSKRNLERHLKKLQVHFMQRMYCRRIESNSCLELITNPRSDVQLNLWC